MTKEKRFKRMVRDVAKRTGQSYAATRARLNRRRENGAALAADASSSYALLRRLASVIDLAAEELNAEELKRSAWASYQQRPGSPDMLLPPHARELRACLESLNDRDIFAVLVIIIWGKLQHMLSFEEAVADARGCIDDYGIDYGIDYAFKKLPASGEYFGDGLMLLERAGLTPASCWEVGFGQSAGTGENRLMQRRMAGRPWDDGQISSSGSA